jgi:uncharacterized C2H2 Zn-finger protein
LPIITYKSRGKYTTRPKSFTCPVCHKGFVRRQNLTSHMSSHTNDRPVPCPECDLTFRRRQEMLRHLRSIHRNAIIVRCPGCDKPFTRNDAYHRHLQSLKARNTGCVARHNELVAQGQEPGLDTS